MAQRRGRPKNADNVWGVIPTIPDEPENTRTEAVSGQDGNTKKGRTDRLAVNLGPLAEELRDAVIFLRAHGSPSITANGIVVEATRTELDRLKRTYNNGDDFPPRTQELSAGRPIKA